jgi:ABC-type Zn uptake system ZnuABC Zn-binding protein ZnuA/ABC-type Mn2+/Zn2+ transport system permease subunit
VLDPFSLPFVQRGLVEILVLAIPAGLLGSWIVLRGLAFFSHAVGTATFPGLVLAAGLGFAAPLGAFGAALAFTALMLALRRGRTDGEDGFTALALVGCLALGVILASDVFHSGSQIETLLFGSLLLVDGQDILLAALAAGAVVAASALVNRRWLAVGFDPANAGAFGSPPLPLDALLLTLIAFSVTASVSAVGAILVSAIFVVPAATARLFTRRLASLQIASIVLVAIEGVVGLWLSVETNAPPGATIAVIAGGVFALAVIVRVAGLASPRVAMATGGAIAALALAGCGTSGGNSGELHVIATTTQIGDFVRQVSGPAVSVDQVLQPNTDPHEYEPRPADIQNAAGATVAFASGDNLDPWISDIVDQSGSDARIVDLGAAVPVHVPGESSGPEASKYDPHWWHDPRNAEAAVREIARQLIAAEPERAAVFRRNAAAYLARLHTLDQGIAHCVATVPAAQRKLVTDHDAFNYFAQRYRIDVVGAVIPSQTTQAQPSAKAVADLVATIRREGVSAVFPESSVNSSTAEAIARETGASSDHTLYGDTLGPEGSSGATYLGMEQANADSMVRGFTGDQRGCTIRGLG